MTVDEPCPVPTGELAVCSAAPATPSGQPPFLQSLVNDVTAASDFSGVRTIQTTVSVGQLTFLPGEWVPFIPPESLTIQWVPGPTPG